MAVLIIVICCIAGIVFWLIALYNGLVSLRNKCDLAWSQIDVMLKKRFDLIPNLVETVKGYASHEKELFEKVASARNLMVNAQGVRDYANADNMITGTLKSLFAVAEAYPELKANENFLNLQNQLSDIETKISYQRQFYNDAVYGFNTLIQQFPSCIVASMFHFTEKEYFKVAEAEKQNVQVRF